MVDPIESPLVAPACPRRRKGVRAAAAIFLPVAACAVAPHDEADRVPAGPAVESSAEEWCSSRGGRARAGCGWSGTRLTAS